MIGDSFKGKTRLEAILENDWHAGEYNKAARDRLF